MKVSLSRLTSGWQSAITNARHRLEHALAWSRTLTNQTSRRRPRVVGRHARPGKVLLPSKLELMAETAAAPFRGKDSVMETPIVRHSCLAGYVGIVIGALLMFLG